MATMGQVVTRDPFRGSIHSWDFEKRIRASIIFFATIQVILKKEIEIEPENKEFLIFDPDFY